ncbi:hypothetical protein JVT61DRAFT_1681 [Boletus reticuloceps]|uniref:Uncharacterized protein n=1 Tax=Boletus reticuloceps TaxID=495285 RepID=A0A8I2YR76_9AGAM|nr:hypothetical protein JVT61DRAFT_1681 [Boletus reticuloceps]
MSVGPRSRVVRDYPELSGVGLGKIWVVTQSFNWDRCKQSQSQKSVRQLLLSVQQSPSAHVPASLGFYRKTALPFFSQNGAYDLTQSLDLDEITQLIQLSCKDEHGFWDLKLAMVKRFQSLCDGISSASDQLYRLLVAPKFGEQLMVERFNCPMQLSTIKSYALEEVRLLCFVLHCIQYKKIAVGASEAPIPSAGGLQISLTSQQFGHFKQFYRFFHPVLRPTP